MYNVTGSNIFGQWFCDQVLFNEFLPLNETKNAFGIDFKRVELRHINWSYNILEISNTLYISGAWGTKEKQLVKIPLPPECVPIDLSELLVVGNDYNILLVNKETVWSIDLDTLRKIKKLNLCIEGPIETVTKKTKLDLLIRKVVVANNACLYLTTHGSVYSGILPSLIETKHCTGKVCDIQCGYEHFVLLTDIGRVYTWGNGRRLQLGHGDVSNLELPTEVDALAGIKIVKIVAGGWHTLALSEFGDLYAWGWNDTGQLGIISKQLYNSIKEFRIRDQEMDNLTVESNNLRYKESGNKKLERIDKALSTTYEEPEISGIHTKILNKESLKSYSLPTLVDIFDDDGYEVTNNIKDIACGSRHSVILLEDGSVWTTGCNKYGQLGLPEGKYPSNNCFKRVFHLDAKCSLMCGPWTSVIIAH